MISHLSSEIDYRETERKLLCYQREKWAFKKWLRLGLFNWFISLKVSWTKTLTENANNFTLKKFCFEILHMIWFYLQSSMSCSCFQSIVIHVTNRINIVNIFCFFHTYFDKVERAISWDQFKTWRAFHFDFTLWVILTWKKKLSARCRHIQYLMEC